MGNSVREEGLDILPHSTFENRTHVSSMKTRAPKEGDTAGLTLFIGVAGNDDDAASASALNGSPIPIIAVRLSTICISAPSAST